MMIGIWVSGIILIGIVVSYLWGRDDMDSELLLPAVAAILLWPVLVTLALIVAPFAIPFAYGIYRRKKANEKNTNVHK